MGGSRSVVIRAIVVMGSTKSRNLNERTQKGTEEHIINMSTPHREFR